MNPAPYPDVAMANELYLYFQNDENLINRRYPEFVKNLERKVKRGIYDREKAVKLFMYLADEVSKKYSKDFGDGKTHWASVPTRMELAKMLLRYYEIARDPSHRVVMNPSSSAARLRRQAEIMEMDERLVPSTMTYEDIKDDPKLIAHYKKIMTPMAWKQLVDDWIRSGIRSGSGRRDFVIPKESEYRRMVSENPEGVRPIQGGGVMFTREGGGVDRFRVMTIKQGLKARKIGMFITRGATTKKLLGMLSQYTGEKYGSRDLERGIADAEKLLASDVNMETQRQIARGLTGNPPPLFKSGGYSVVITLKSGEVQIGDAFPTKEQAESYKKYLRRGRGRWGNVERIQVLPVTSVVKNPPLSSHGSSIRTKRTHGLSLAQMRALYKLVQRGNDMAVAYARKKLEVPRSASKSDLLAVVDHHIRDLADR
jgi:hypothetical protein